MLCRLLVALLWTLLVLTIFESVGAVPVDDSVEWPGIIPDEETGVRVAQWTKESKVNPEELGSYLEGDIMVTKSITRNGIKNSKARWPDGTIPYVISGTFNSYQRNLINDAINRYRNCTCIKFNPRKNENDYINITSDKTGCWSYIGRIGGRQQLNLQTDGCVSVLGTVIHEFMHALGFLHEHTREDRDSYVYINETNIEDGAEGNFRKAGSGTTIDYGVPFNYSRVMHYSRDAFSKNKYPTIITTNPKNSPIGQRKDFSKSDVTKINKMYNCSSNNNKCSVK